MKVRFAFTLLTVLLPIHVLAAQANEPEWLTTTTLLKESKYKDGFEHYDYVNPDAPKGGTLNKSTRGTFDSFNPFIVKGNTAAGLTSFGGILWDTLMTQSPQEPSVSHPLIAEAYSHPDDYSSATYRIDPRAKWHDGTPITAEDVKWSMEILKEHSPTHTKYFADVKEVRIDNERQVTFLFSQKNNRELPHIMGDLPVLPKAWFEGTGADGKKRDFKRTTLEPPLGNGPYKIGDFSPGSSITWERVKDYWAKDLPVRVGRYNYDRIRYVYFKDSNAVWEAFKKGGLDDYRAENSARRWKTEYVFPAAKSGQVRQKTFPVESAYVTQMIYLNLRREKFQNLKLRKALNWAFNFEFLNENLFFGQYSRSTSFFGGTELSASGVPDGRELEILEEYRGRIPEELFTEEYRLPAYTERRDERKHLRTAVDLLKEAGYERRGTQMVNIETGEPLILEFLSSSTTTERSIAPWLNQLKKLGIEANFRVVDQSQYIQRIYGGEFDLALIATQQSVSPGNEQREYWSSSAADRPGSRNYGGIKNPVIDELVERIIYAPNRDEQVALTHALERILQFNYYTVPAWTLSDEWYAFWDKIVTPDKQPAYAGVDPFSWWIDPKHH